MAKVIYRDTRGIQRTQVLNNITRIGRHPEQDIQILDRVVSKEHALIERNIEGHFVVRDGGSRNGTYLNGQLLDAPQLLHNGDAISVGATDLIFQEDPTDRRSQNKVTIHTDELESHVRNRIAQNISARFLPESQISDTTALRQDYEKLRIAHELGQSIGVETDLDILLEKILEKAFEIFPADHGVILLRLEGTDRLVPMVVRGRTEQVHVGDVRISRTILNEVIEEKQAVLSSDAMMDSRFSGAHSIILGNIRSTMSVPLLLDEQILGVIHLDSKVASGAFTEKDLEILSGFARQAAMLIEHHRLLKQMESEILAREKLHRLLSPQLVEEVVSGRLELKKGGELRRATVMFADIRNFTSYSERHEPQQVVELLNEYFELMVDVIFKYEGTLDKFIGDEIMAVWGAPISHPDDTERAVRCALEMQQILHTFNANRQDAQGHTLSIGIGLNTGEVVAGYMGSTKSMNYTVMGDAVNTASRICASAGPGEVVVGQSTFAEVTNLVTSEKLPPTRLKGKREHVDLYRLRGLRTRPVHPTLRNLT
ncbi:adenylate cyclase [Lujinxingia litoralis]|uniref:Adenylate cyclase n=1 Tax=Lujinxingia litoralis TaxID=2211119 RepID=A0A328C814_9DELT|nr:adenylate/guanylate cyclase domain-containing protein [Lujinxingia litoralis]RAL22810.1 adenylate cyclase [Lujinxingia litoralis]